MPNQYPTHGWNEERVAELRLLHADGWSASRIARQFGDVTRNSVIGKLHRLGLRRSRPASPRPVIVRASREDSARARTAVHRVAQAKAAEPPRLVADPLPPEHPETPLVRDLLALEAHHCRWPIGEPQGEDFGFCGRPRDVGSYCRKHHLAAHQPGTATSPNQLARSVRRYAASGTVANEAA